MKKQSIVKSLLLLLPVLAVGLATTANSVTVLDPATGVAEYYSYFDLLPVQNQSMVPVLAAVLALLSGILAAFYLGKKNGKCLKASGYVAFVAASAACIPIVFRGEQIVIPNVGLPIFMMLHFLIARYVEKLPAEVNEKKTPKLELHR